MSARAGKAMRGWAPLKLLAIVLVVAVVITGLAWWLWPRGGGGGQPVENVRFDYEMRFAYIGSEDNRPLENLYLWFPLPQVENELAGDLFTNWALYYLEDDNTLTFQMDHWGVENLRGSRTSALGILHYEVGMTLNWGPATSWKLDRLYPREVFVEVDILNVDNYKANSTTARAYGQTAPVASWRIVEEENRRIDLSFTALLYRENALIEAWQWTQENSKAASYWLWPVT